MKRQLFMISLIVVFASIVIVPFWSWAQSGGKRRKPRQGPPPGAFKACKNKSEGTTCTVNTPRGKLTGTCMTIQNQIACVPEGGPGGPGGSGGPGGQSNTGRQQSGRQSSGTGNKQLMDVHGAGAQRSDPKSGNPARFSGGHGPQGDVVYIYNYARCVRGSSSANASAPYAIVDTGQDKCYGDGKTGRLRSCPGTGQAFYGQDAQYTGAALRYTNNGDGTITDQVTGLMWQKAFKQVSWANAPSDAASDKTGGYRDWRVPTIKELYSLIDFNGMTGSAAPETTGAPSDAVPYLDTTYFDFEYPTTGRYIDVQYVTSTAYVSTVMNNQKAFFGYNFADGRIKGYPQSGRPNKNTYYARYVRGNVTYGKNDFRDNGDQTVSDNATGLTWMKVDSGDSSVRSNLRKYAKSDGSLNWEEALDFCENLTYAGSDDWRLPNAKELQSLVDYTRSPDTTNSAAIDPVFSVTSITDPGGDKDYPFFWSSTTHLGGRILGEYAIYVAFGEAEGYMEFRR